ncbi:MAG: PAS domain-containing protein, partial [Myxococcota bacterium]
MNEDTRPSSLVSSEEAQTSPSSRSEGLHCETMFNLLPHPTFTTDAAARIVLWNDALVDLTGIQRQEAVGKKAWEVLCGTRTITPVAQALMLSDSCDEHFPITTPKTGKCSLDWVVRPNVSASGASTGAVTVLKTPDHARRPCDRVPDCSPNPVLVCDTDLIITYANLAALEMLRNIEAHMPLDADALVGQSIDIFHSQQRRLLADPRNLPHTTRIQVGP